MRSATRTAKRYAESLLTLEANQHTSERCERPMALEVCERMRPHLATLMGTYGYQAIIGRALRLASAETPWLITLRFLPAGTWEVPEQLATKISAEQMAEGNLVLVAHLLGLLMALMGEEVTLRQIHEVWSKQRLDEGPGVDRHIL